jgi:hypothetical protein
MAGGREDHVQAVGFAGLKIQEVENVLMQAREMLNNEALPLVLVAVGDNPIIDSARNALEFTQLMDQKIEELLGIAEQAKAEMNRYSGGF